MVPFRCSVMLFHVDMERMTFRPRHHEKKIQLITHGVRHRMAGTLRWQYAQKFREAYVDNSGFNKIFRSYPQDSTEESVIK